MALTVTSCSASRSSQCLLAGPQPTFLLASTPPTYAAATVGGLREAGFRVIPTGGGPDHYDEQLLDRVDEDDDRPSAEVKLATARMLAAAGPLRPNPAYPGVEPMTPEEA